MKSIIDLTAVSICVAVMSCASYYSAPVPMRTVFHQEKRAQGHDTLVVFLPGHRSLPEDFAAEGLVDMLRKNRPRVDSLAAGATLGYFIKESLPERLREDIILPARARGYKKIWLVGISMGGSGALWYLKKYPSTVQGVLLLSPFIADKDVVKEVESAGGLAKWEPRSPLDKKDYQRAQLLWLKSYLNPNPALPVLALGFGDSDRFRLSNRMLAGILPAGRVVTVPGGHDWKTWAGIFEKFVRAGLF